MDGLADEQQQNDQKSKQPLNKERLKKTYQIFRYIYPYRWSFAFGLVFLVLSSATLLIFPYITGKLVDAATGESSWWLNDIDKIALGLLVILVFQSVFSYLRINLFAQVSERGMADIRKDLYAKLMTLPYPFFETRRVGELTSRITSDVTQIQDTLSLTLAEFFRQITTLLIGVIIIAVTSPQLTLVMLISFPVLIVAAVIFGRFIRKLSRKTQDSLANANVIVEETLQSINIVKAFTNELFETRRYNQRIDEVIGYALRAAKYRGLFVSFVIFALFGAIVLVLWYGSHLVSQGQLSIGDLTAFIIYTTFIGGSVGGMGDLYSKIQKTIGATERILAILKEESAVQIDQMSGASQQTQQVRGDIVYDNVSFAYPSRTDINVLDHVNLTINAGQKVALAGPSGAGKSTIIQLLLGFHAPKEGNIYVDQKSISAYNKTAYRQNIGIVPQEVVLFGGTIKENIGYGNPSADEDAIVEAARNANAFDFIQNFTDGFETVVGERGVRLSGGQKQRIAIARAILKDPSILVLDEATSSLDAESEQLVQEALGKLMENRTTIVIAHRLSTIQKVDRIFVLNQGELVESGTHNELIQKEEGLYHNLVKLQFQEA